MSGIVGLFRKDGQSIDRHVLDRMLSAVAHRGPHGRAIWCGKGAGLGHTLLQAKGNPSETLPLVQGNLVLTADVRLDNRQELEESLGLSPDKSDAAFILAAYRHWGENCTEHLLGDFAFAVWDGARRSMFCARDHFGVKPLYYYHDKRRFFLASEIKAIFASSEVSLEVDDARIADYLVPMVADNESTLYKGILRLPPHHTLTVSRAGKRLSSYWQLQRTPITRCNSLPEQFREIFTAAVRCRLRAGDEVGTMLSGGLDSSSIACVASDLRKKQGRSLPTLSVAFDESSEWNERPFIETILESGSFDPLFIPSDGYAPFGNLRQALRIQDGIFFAPGPIAARIYRAAPRQGVRVLLDGHGGDEVVSQGYGRLRELAMAGHWLMLWHEIRALSYAFKEPTWRTFGRYLNRYGPTRSSASLRRFLTRPRRWLRNDRSRSARPAWCHFINEELVTNTDLEQRYLTQRRMDVESMNSEQSQHFRVLTSPLQPYMFEILDRASAAAGVEPRYPFWDKRLAEFCLSLPSEQKLKDGWGRLILRRGMEGVLPPSVQWRRDKFDFSPLLIRGMLSYHRELIDGIVLGDAGEVSRYVDLPAVAAAYLRMIKREDAAESIDMFAIWRTVVLGEWLCDPDSPRAP